MSRKTRAARRPNFLVILIDDLRFDELYDLERDPYEIDNAISRPAYRKVRETLRRELRRLAAEAAGL